MPAVLAAGISAASASAPAPHRAPLAAPALQAPADGSSWQSLPVMTWRPVTGAAHYEYQVSADSAFAAIILGSGTGKGSSTTYATAAALGQAVPDGTYYWRVRAIDAKSNAGPWSGVRRIVKRWSVPPRLLAPRKTSVSWPSTPLVLRWSSVPYAVTYLVTVATDRTMSNQVVGSSTQPQTTQATAFAVPTALGPGRYYWQVTPEDAAGRRGRPSAIAAFTWRWPTLTKPAIANTNPNPQAFDPKFSWTPVAGAARYQVEINTSQDFPAGSQWCCTAAVIGTSLSPTQNLGNATTYYWRVRAVDAQGDAGRWYEGPKFTKAFDPAPPTIQKLTMSDVNGNPQASPVQTATPIVTWSPVPGASRYEVQVGDYAGGPGCDWASPRTYETATTAWTPLGNTLNSRPGPSAWPQPQMDIQSITAPGDILSPQLPPPLTEWCVRVLARGDDDGKGNQVVSEWTQVGGVGNPAFILVRQVAPAPPSGSLVMPASGYIMPAQGTVTARTPLFTWQPVPGAAGYYVVIARDPGFTQVADVGFTNVTAYAPDLATGEPLADQTTGYYWAVIPAAATLTAPPPPQHVTGYAVFTNPPGQDSPQNFTKSSTPPTLQAPTAGARVAAQPTFGWTQAENARSYTLEVASSPSFGNPIDDITTDSTQYTSTSTYPANRVLYWRVRANDWAGRARLVSDGPLPPHAADPRARAPQPEPWPRHRSAALGAGPRARSPTTSRSTRATAPPTTTPSTRRRSRRRRPTASARGAGRCAPISRRRASRPSPAGSRRSDVRANAARAARRARRPRANAARDLLAAGSRGQAVRGRRLELE